MSIDDKFYPNDGTTLTRFDNAMIKATGKMGVFYQYVTGKSYKNLVKSSYKLSAKGFAIAGFGLSPFVRLKDLAKSSATYPTYCSSIEEEIRLELKGRDKDTKKIGRSLLFAMTLGCLYFHSNVVAHSDAFYINENIIKYIGIGNIFGASCAIPFLFAEYLSKANVSPPPKKNVLEKIGDKIKTAVSPTPVFAPDILMYSQKLY